MPDVLPTINNEPPQGIQATLDLIYLWNQDVANDLIEQLNDALAHIDLSAYRTAADQDIIDEGLEDAITAVQNQVSGKQDVIPDLADIRKGASRFVYEQGESSTLWTITHNLDKYPSVTIVDSAGSVIECTVTYINSNTCEVRFSAPFKGRAYLN